MNAPKKNSLAGRALLAVVLMFGFYLLALCIAGVLIYLPYAEVVYAHRLHPKLALVCGLGALAILWSVLPRRDKFEPPGPPLKPDEQPRLFAELKGVADSVGQAMPAEVYAVPDVNAWVAQRGGFMGFGSRRVMGLGLPLMQLLTRSQFRAVLAHEFGHYHGGDTKLGPWIYKTRGAIGRTLGSLGGNGGKGSLLQLPFLWYGNMFLRITHAISRRQEFVADALAASAVGARPLAEGLRTVHGVAPAFQSYWLNECVPVLSAGYRPPLADGFAVFVGAKPVAEAIARHVDEELQSGKADPYDTHPPLKERIAALGDSPSADAPAEDAAAITLLDNVPALEQELLTAIADPAKVKALKPIPWDAVTASVYQPQWSGLVKANATALSGVTPDSFPGLAADLKSFGSRCVSPGGESPPDEQAAGLAAGVLGAALALSLIGRGGLIETRPGMPVVVGLAGASVEPFSIAPKLAEGKLAVDDWRQQCAELGVGSEDLGKLAQSL